MNNQIAVKLFVLFECLVWAGILLAMIVTGVRAWMHHRRTVRQALILEKMAEKGQG